ncbi:DUF2070 family protein [Candidatus Bathyarchaeota archaeon]|nr:DUF2070 family protein [Candidatus Bathyarchaeota archaeon]
MKRKELLETENFTGDYIDRATKHYSSLFTLPSNRKLILCLLATSVIAGFVATETLIGLIYFASTVLLNMVLKRSLFKEDPLINLKRLSALSLFSLVIWTFFIVLGGALQLLFKSYLIWIKLVFVGLSASTAIRFLIFYVLSFRSRPAALSASIAEPLLISFLTLYQKPGFNHIASGATYYTTHALLYISASLISVTLYIKFIDNEKSGIKGLTPITLFKAFLADWMEDLNSPLEDVLDRIGTPKTIKVSLLRFASKGKSKALIAVPRIHPGPFKNVGSSPLPHLLADALRKEFGCVALVPHSLSGHDLNLTSRDQTNRLIERVLLATPKLKASSDLASPPQKARVGCAEAHCQVFGRCAFITLTVSPKTMEDLPPELDDFIDRESRKRGLDCAVVVDAHNSIDKPSDVRSYLPELKKAALKSMDLALKLRKRKFEVGCSNVYVEGVGVKEGLGLGGISVLAVKVGNDRSAYILIDGNNMLSGLREKILSSLSELGVRDGEVMTTDTHTVNGVVLTKRGWHPIGEAIDDKKLIECIKSGVKQAFSNLEPAEVSWGTCTIPDLKVIGEEQINSLCIGTDEMVKKAKTLALTIFPTLGLVISLIIAFV